jgi:hypothetical protein
MSPPRMPNASGRQSDAPAGMPSRRDMIVTLAGSMAIAGVALSVVGGDVAEAQSKTSQQTAKYQDHPNNGNHCSICNYFRPPHGCQLVEGTINPNGWCSFFAKKP